MKLLKEAEVTGKKVLIRCDFNVPQDDQGNITDDFRITQTLPTLRHLIEHKAKVIIAMHLGDPEGKRNDALSVAPIASHLSKLLGMSVGKTDDCIGGEVEEKVNNLKEGEVLLLENLRFHKEETENDEQFAKQLASLGDLYVNDAFGVCHRAHASVQAITKFLPSYAGLLLEKEITTLEKVLHNPEKPMVSLVGGTKVGTKSKFIDNISQTADTVIISGLLKKEIGEKGLVFKYPEKIVGPEGDLTAMDIDEETREMFKGIILKAKTVLWNGPFGKFEEKEYAEGSLALANAIIESGAFSVVGGGETVEFLAKEGILNQFSHVSTGGGAMLNFLAGDVLPGLEALKNAT